MNTALLVIDVQQMLVDYLEPSRRAEFLATLASLIGRTRAAGIAVVYVRHCDDELRPGTPAWEIAADIAPQAGEPVVDKTFRDSFRETKLYDTLCGLGVDRLIVCGMQTEFCVDATIREAERRGYRVTLVADGHATYPAGGATEEQIRDQVHRVAQGCTANVVALKDLAFDAV